MTGALLDIQLQNAAGAAIVVTGQNNSLNLVITNDSGADFHLRAGVPRNPPAAGPFTLVLDFSSFYATRSGQKIMRITRTGWSASFGGGQFPAWAVCPEIAVTWKAGTQLVFEISGFEPTVAADTYFLEADVYNLSANPPIPNTVTVFVANPPGQKTNLTGIVGATLQDSTVFITKTTAQRVSNSLVVRLANESGLPLVPVATEWGSDPPTFVLSFVPASNRFGYFSLAAPDQIAAFRVGATGGTTGWKITQDTSRNIWKLQPDPATNHAILGTGADAIAEFSVGNIVTELVSGPTVLSIQYVNIPGFNDGFLSAIVDKAYADVTMTLSVNQTTAFSPAQTGGFLNWNVQNALAVVLEGVQSVDPVVNGFPITVQQRQTFVLTAYDPFGGTVTTANVAVDFDPEMSGLILPPGLITTWQGPLSSVPAGFLVCDGTNGTPDLRDRFILGAGLSQQPGDSGDPTHTHTLDGFQGTFPTTSDGFHSHGSPTAWFTTSVSSGDDSAIAAQGGYTDTATTVSSGAHSHSLSVQFPSVATSVNDGSLRPAWFALIFIMAALPTS